jgi:hypothetical protein
MKDIFPLCLSLLCMIFHAVVQVNRAHDSRCVRHIPYRKFLFLHIEAQSLLLDTKQLFHTLELLSDRICYP